MLAHLWAWFMANCWGNLVASVLWAAPTFAWHHRRLKRHHADQLRQVKEQHAEDLRQTRVHLLGALAETRDHLLKAIGEQQGGDR